MAASFNFDRARFFAASIGLVVAFLAAAWLLGLFESEDLFSDDPAVAGLQRKMQEVNAKGDSGPNRDADVKRLVQQYQQLTPQQRQDFNRRKLLMYLPEQERELREFFAQSTADQRAQIDQEIDAVEAKLPRSGSGNVKNAKTSNSGSDPSRIMAMKQLWTANASPELRSLMDRRVRMINQRRAERGLPPL